MLPLLLLYFLETRLFNTSLLLFGTIPGKVPCFITTKTYYFWQVSWFPYDCINSLGPRLPFRATAKVAPCLLAPETGDITQALPGIQSTSLPGLFCSNQGFYFLWVILYFLCREFYQIPIQTILGDVSFFSTWIAWISAWFNWVFFERVLHLFLHHRFF